MIVDKLAEFGQSKQQAVAEGVAFEQADSLEKGQAQPAQGLEEEAMQMRSFYSQCEEVASNTKHFEELTDHLEKLHKQALTASTTEESGELSVRIDVMTAKINTYSNKNRSILKNLESENGQLAEIAPAGSGHMRMREAKHRQLATSFLKSTKKLQKMQTLYRDKYRQQLERQYKIVKPNATAEEIARVTSDEGAAQAQIFAAAVKDDAKKTLSQMKNRFGDVKLIEKSILELHQLFMDLQTMIVEQGDVINKVGYNVDKTANYNESAAQDMKLAVEYQKSIWKKKWILMILIIIGVVILLLLILWLLRPLFQMIAYTQRP